MLGTWVGDVRESGMAERIAGRAKALLAICPLQSHLGFMERQAQLESTNAVSG
jgi:hypothetical protein